MRRARFSSSVFSEHISDRCLRLVPELTSVEAAVCNQRSELAPVET